MVVCQVLGAFGPQHLERDRGGSKGADSIKGKESLFCLTTPLERIDFHIIGYWMSSIYGHCDIASYSAHAHERCASSLHHKCSSLVVPNAGVYARLAVQQIETPKHTKQINTPYQIILV